MKTHTSTPPSRRDRERDAHRGEILEAAERVFAAKGYEAATVEEIAREAEFATGTLYNFFDGKEALFLAVADRILDDLVARFDEEIEPLKATPCEALRRFVALRLQEISTHEPFFHVFHPARCARNALSGKPHTPDRRFLAYRDKAIGLFAEGIRQGLVHDAPPAELLGVVEGAIRFFVRFWDRPGAKPPSQEERLRILDRSLLALLWAHPTQGTPPT
jgi:AcrR family transcriptional regulator